MIRLYHGSNVAIEQIDLSRSKRGKDFGRASISMPIQYRQWRWPYGQSVLQTKVSQYCHALNLMKTRLTKWD